MSADQFQLISEQPATRLTANDAPQARYQALGCHALSDRELVALALALPADDSMALASRILNDAGTVQTLAKWTVSDFVTAGVTRAKAFQLVAFSELGRRAQLTTTEAPLLNRADLVAAHLSPIIGVCDVEKFVVLCLNRKNRLLKQVEVSSGTATAALAHPREVFRAAIQHGATAIICAHNHPSGDPAPSAADLHLTRQLREAAKAVEIDLIDHVVIGRAGADPIGRGFYSFREAGVL